MNNGIDSPEIRGSSKCEKERALRAKKLVRDTLSNAKVINLKRIKRGKYFRIVADVEYDRGDLGAMLIKMGLARKYDGAKKSKKGWCE
jgi:endonuclease YncB( thermonuclease family)